MAHTDFTHDIVVVGGGLAGATMAYALRDLNLRIAVVEAQPFVVDTPASYDERAIALAYGSRRIFDGLSLWPALAALATPIRDIHISERGHFGVTHLHASDYDVDALGYVATHRDLGRIIMQRATANPDIELICPATVTGLDITEDAARVQLQDARELRAKLVIAADGGQSPVRRLLGIDAMQWRYDQTAIISTVSPQHPHNFVAYERFTPSGPLALLPMSEQRLSLVMTVPNNAVTATLALDDGAFLDTLGARFGGRLGYFTRAAPRRAYPLQLIYAAESSRHRLALIGNAAHTLHPIAGQGFNLGLRDIAALADVIAPAARARQDFGKVETLRAYDRWRQTDHRRTIAFTDGLARLFANDFAALALARNLGLAALQRLPSIKNTVARVTMGLQGPLPRLARGLPV